MSSAQSDDKHRKAESDLRHLLGLGAAFLTEASRALGDQIDQWLTPERRRFLAALGQAAEDGRFQRAIDEVSAALDAAIAEYEESRTPSSSARWMLP